MFFNEKKVKKILFFKKMRYFTNSSIPGVNQIIKMIMKLSVKVILLPSCIGSPLGNIEELLKKGKYHLILLIHYFVFCQIDLKSLVKLCKKYNVKVIEDYFHLSPSHNSEKNILEYFRAKIFLSFKGYFYDI